MFRNKTYNRKKILIVFAGVMLVLGILVGRLVYLMNFLFPVLWAAGRRFT